MSRTLRLGLLRKFPLLFKSETVDLAFLSLLIATLSDVAIEHVLGCNLPVKLCLSLNLKTLSKSKINMLKTEFQTIQKGGYSIDKFLARLKSIRDQLTAAGEFVSDNDLMISALACLPREYAIIRTVIFARKSSISLKKLRAQLLNTESDIESNENTLSTSMAAMYVQGSTSQSHSGQG